MYPSNVLKVLSKSEVKQLSKFLNQFFPLVKADRIYNLILQVDSIDTALHLLVCHKESSMTLDSLVFMYLQGKDNSIKPEIC